MNLASLILESAESQDDILCILSGMLTPLEIEELNKRINIGILLINHLSYIKIEEKLGVSSTTIAKVAKTLSSNHSYEKLLRVISSKINP